MTSRLTAGFDLAGYEFGAGVPMEDIQAALSVIGRHSAPIQPIELVGLLGELKIKTKQTKLDQNDMEVMLKVYARELLQFPHDIVREVLTSWPKNNIWWPSWSELESDIEWRNKRGKMKIALEKELARQLARSSTSAKST